MTNRRIETAKKAECDGRDYTLKVKLGPVSVSVWKYQESEKVAVQNPMEAEEKETA